MMKSQFSATEWRTSLCWFVFAAAAFASAAGFIRQAPGDDESRYAGRTLDQWSELIKTEPISSLGRPEIVQGLLEIIQDVKVPWADRRQAALTLGRIGEPARDAVPVLQRLLTNHETDSRATRLWALRALALLGAVAEAATDSVESIVRDSDEPVLVRATAMETLGRIGANRESALAMLLAILRSDQNQPVPRDAKELRLAAAEALGLFGAGAQGALPELMRASQADWPLLRRAALQSIGRIGPRAEIAVSMLVDVVLFDEAAEVHEAAVDALGQIGSPALPAIGQLLADRDAGVRRLAIRGLRSTASTDLSQKLLSMTLKDDSPLVRVEGAAALVSKVPGDRQALETLLSELVSEQRDVRIIAYRVLREQAATLVPFRSRLQMIERDSEVPAQSRTAAARLLELIP